MDYRHSMHSIITTISLVTFLYWTEVSGDRRGHKEADNYIITQYGIEHYDPVSEEDMKQHTGGYFKSEVIPVDPVSGEEIRANDWKPTDHLFVPVKSGYSVNEQNSHPVYNEDSGDYQQPESDYGGSETGPSNYHHSETDPNPYHSESFEDYPSEAEPEERQSNEDFSQPLSASIHVQDHQEYNAYNSPHINEGYSEEKDNGMDNEYHPNQKDWVKLEKNKRKKYKLPVASVKEYDNYKGSRSAKPAGVITDK